MYHTYIMKYLPTMRNRITLKKKSLSLIFLMQNNEKMNTISGYVVQAHLHLSCLLILFYFISANAPSVPLQSCI